MIFFPPKYKKSLLLGKKNMTIRHGNEIGKYKVGRIYHAVSYSEKIDFGLNVKIINVLLLKINELSNFNIPKLTIKKLEKETSGPVEIIKFIVV